MDHLPLPKFTQPMPSPLAIPRLTLERYDNGPFDEYPDRMKRRGKGRLDSFSDSISFLQTWLFFGLIGTIFECDTNRVWEDFSKGHEDVVTTALLIPYTKTYLPSFSPEHRTKVYYCLHIAYDRLNSICNRPIESPSHSKVLLSLSTLGEFLSIAMVWYFREDYVKLSPKLLRAWPAGIPGNGHFLSQRMQNDGWCCKDITGLLQRLPTSGLYYVSHFGNPDAHTSHSSCSFTECESEEIAKHTYQTKHAEDCSRHTEGGENSCCDEVEADPRQLVSILRKGSIPLIPVTDDSSLNSHSRYMNLVESGPKMTYVAISHVWSEGLGNESYNSLPRCQLLRLSQFVTELYGTKPAGQLCFWIDTICCPREDEFRGVAIGRMADTYAEADKVLVLDSWLQTQAMDIQSHYELGLKVFVSKWSKRLWTLQEGALANELAFRFKGGSVLYPDEQFDEDCLSMNSRLNLDSANIDQIMLKMAYEDLHPALRVYRLSTAHEQLERRRKIGIIRGLKYRATSHEHDEALCLGTLFGVDVQKIFETQPETRMATFWKLLHNIPSSLIFSFAPRLELDGYRWAPRTVRWVTSAVFYDHYKYAPDHGTIQEFAEGSGLLVKYPGVLFDCPRKPLSHTIYFKSDHWYVVSCNNFYETRKATFGMDPPNPIAESHKEIVDWYRNVRSSKQPSVGLILNVGLATVDKPIFEERAILVSIREESNNVIFANFESTARVSRAQNYLPDIRCRKKTVKVVRRTEKRGDSQKWCLL